jgi:hypothetical protein
MVKSIIGKEEELTNYHWQQVSGNFLHWCNKWDKSGKVARRWQQHFTFLSKHQECDEHFQAILLTNMHQMLRTTTLLADLTQCLS